MNRLLLLCAVCGACASTDDGFSVTVDGDRITGALAVDDATLGFEASPGELRFLDDRGAPLVIALDRPAALALDDVAEARTDARLASRALLPELADRLADLAVAEPSAARVRDALVDTARAETGAASVAAATSVMVGLSRSCGSEYAEVGVFHNGTGSAGFSYGWYLGGSSVGVYTYGTATVSFSYAYSGISRPVISKVRISSTHWGHSWIDWIYDVCE